MKASIKKIGMFLGLLMTFLTSVAYDFEADGIYYTITSMADLEVEVSPKQFTEIHYNGSWCWENNTPYTGTVSVPSTVNYMNRTYTVVGIGKAAFGYPQQYYSGQINYIDATPYGKPTTVTHVVLPSTVRYIDAMAFQGCQISTITLPSTLKTIGLASFAYSKLQSVDTPASVSTIEKSAFFGSSIMSVILRNGINTISEKAFSGCSSLLEVFCTSSTCPSGLSVSTFSGAHSALEIYVPSSEVYGFGRNYLTFRDSVYDYTGHSHNIEWTNNLKAYKCEIVESECQTEVNAGHYTKDLTATYSNGVSLTVQIPYEYTITPAPLTLTVHDTKRTYGEGDPEFTCEMNGIVNDVDTSNLMTAVTYECSATERSKVGTYPIRAALIDPNYNITYKYGELTVVPAPLYITVDDAERIYGNANPTFAINFTGLVNDETAPEWKTRPMISSVADKESPIGEYAITVSDGEAVNYEIARVTEGTLTVTKRDLTVKAQDSSRLYGEENPEFQVSYSGFVNGDSRESLKEEAVAQCEATPTSEVGVYPIVPSGGEAQNYAFVYEDGELTIKPLNVGFANEYNTVTYNNMDESRTEEYFYYVPEINGPYSQEDFEIKVWALDKDNQFNDHDITIKTGEYAGNYVSYTGPSYAGKYIYELVKKSNDPNAELVSNRAYATVNSASTDLEWESPTILRVPVDESIELEITSEADSNCIFNFEYDEDIMKVYSEENENKELKWYVKGLREGSAILELQLIGQKNQFGFYNYKTSSKLSHRVETYYDPSLSVKIDYYIGEIGSMSTIVKIGEPVTVDLSGSADWKVKEVLFNDEEVELEGDTYTTPNLIKDSTIKVEYEYAHEIDYDFTTDIELPLSCPYQVKSEGNLLIISGLNEGDKILIYTVGGFIVADLPPAPASKVSLTLDEGQTYIVLINGAALKITH